MSPVHTPDRYFNELTISPSIPRNVAPAGVSLSGEAPGLFMETGDHRSGLGDPSIGGRQEESPERQGYGHSKHRAKEFSRCHRDGQRTTPPRRQETEACPGSGAE